MLAAIITVMNHEDNDLMLTVISSASQALRSLLGKGVNMPAAVLGSLLSAIKLQ